MKYFAKYLPVEGEIKEGDIIPDPTGIMEYLTVPKDKLSQEVYDLAGVKKLEDKLMLCSRDIQVGDKFYREATGNKEFIAPTNFQYWEGDYKVIGEISPDATWVKEGDEFDVDGLAYLHDTVNGKIYLPLDRNTEVAKSNIIAVKDLCGHFH